MDEHDFESRPTVSDCISLVHIVSKKVSKQSTETIVNNLINFESSYNIELPEDIASIIDIFFEAPIFPSSYRDKLVGYILLLECDLMIGEDGDLMRTAII